MSKDMTHADALRAWAAQYATSTARAQFLVGADALDTLAADTLEYGVVDAAGDIEWFPVDATFGTVEDARRDAVHYANSDPLFRLVARRVSAPWEVTDE